MFVTRLLTFEALSCPEKFEKIIQNASNKLWSERQEFLKSVNLTIHEGKHIVGHPNFESYLQKSIWEYPLDQTQEFIFANAGKGIPFKGKLGVPGYQEIVNFNVHVGYVMIRTTGMKIPTTWGKIHYARDGVHVIPFLPE